MLDSSSLQQLQQLKSSIRKEARRYEGLVIGGRSNYGFVRTNKGRQYFLPPPQMLRTLPGDRIDFSVKTDDQGREYAEVEELVQSTLKIFCGKCIQQRNAWFVLSDLPQMQRKIFIPPKQRKGIKPGDWVQCQLSRHPIRDGKAQALVKQRIASEDEQDFPSHYACVNFQIPKPFAPIAQGPELLDEALAQSRIDHTALPLVSIDAPETGDIDDALCARPLEDGWELLVAIADPSSVISPDSPLDREAQRRASTAYLPHFKSTMLPVELSENLFSLKAGVVRPAIVCRFEVSSDGDIRDSEFALAKVRSRAQLSYAELNGHLRAGTLPEHLEPDVEHSLTAMHAVSQALRTKRKQSPPLGRGRPEFKSRLDSKGRVENYEAIDQGPAQQLVEECMVLANQAASQRLAAAGVGIFSAHGGFRTERLGDIQTMLDEAGIEQSARDLNQPDTFHATMALLRDKPGGEQALNVLSRFLQRSSLSAGAAPHVGMGLASYTTFTSPLRRYVDLHNHRQIKALLAGERASPCNEATLETLDAQVSQVRLASRWAERWLQCDYAARHWAEFKQKTHAGQVVQVNNTGLVVRLDDNGIEGLIEKRSLPQGMSFNGKKLHYHDGKRTLSLGDHLTVTMGSVRRDLREIVFKLPADVSQATAPNKSSGESTAERVNTETLNSGDQVA